MSIHEIRVTQGIGFDDPRAEKLRDEATRLGLPINEVRTTDVYHVEGLRPPELELLKFIVADPVREIVTITPRDDWKNDHKLEVAPLPGVMNPGVDGVVTAARTIGLDPSAIQTGVQYEFDKMTPRRTLDGVVRLLVNPTVEEMRRQAPETLEVQGNPEPIQAIDVRWFDDDQLIALSKERKLALNLAEMQSIRAEAERLERPLSDVELEYLGAAWSEHCCHKTFAADIIKPDGTVEKPLFQRIKDSSRPFFEERGVLSAFHDNSGVWRFYDETALCIKLETHNSPMNLEPYGGSATGIGGVLRDIVATGRGARVINSQHMQFLASLDYGVDDIPEGCHTPEYLLSRSVAGVSDYGNRMGVPTNDVSFHTHPNYRGKGSILVGAMGIMPENNAYKGVPKAGDLVIAAGGMTGRDGLHGATFSSESADSNTSNLHSGAVQIGNAIEEKKVFDAIQEASSKGLIIAMTDCGAAGFASAVGEMGEDVGVSIDLANASLKYEGLSPWEIFLSESQERMVLAIDASHCDEIAAIFEKHGSRADVLGTFGYIEDNEPMLHVAHKGETVVHLGYDFIKNGLPDQALEAEWISPEMAERQPINLPFDQALQRVLSNGNVCSTEPIVRQYDHEVQGTNALKPFTGPHYEGRNEAVVMTPLLGKSFAVVEAHGCNPTIADIDPWNGSIWSYTEAMSNFVAAGGNPNDAVIVNNFISATPTPRVLGALSKSVSGLMECVEEFRSPVISGKDSLSSTFKLSNGELIESPYNLIVTVAGKIPDVQQTISSDLKKTGSTLVLVGRQDLDSMGGSVYYEEAGGQSKAVPKIDLPTFHHTATTLHQAIRKNKVLSVQDVAEGGLGATVAQMAIGGDTSVRLTLDGATLQNTLFNETAGCFIVEVDSPHIVDELFDGVPHQVIGQTMDSDAEKEICLYAINPEDGTTQTVGRIALATARAAWQRPMEEIFG